MRTGRSLAFFRNVTGILRGRWRQRVLPRRAGLVAGLAVAGTLLVTAALAIASIWVLIQPMEMRGVGFIG